MESCTVPSSTSSSPSSQAHFGKNVYVCSCTYHLVFFPAWTKCHEHVSCSKTPGCPRPAWKRNQFERSQGGLGSGTSLYEGSLGYGPLGNPIVIQNAHINLRRKRAFHSNSRHLAGCQNENLTSRHLTACFCAKKECPYSWGQSQRSNPI